MRDCAGMNDKGPEYSVVVPVYNEKDNISILHEKISSVFERLGEEYEILYVDDNSDDGSLEILNSISSGSGMVKVLSLAKRGGQSCALYAGFLNSAGRWIVMMDADLQNDPADIINMTDFKKDSDFITGIRSERADGWLKRASSSVARKIRQAVLKDSIQDVGCSLRMFRRDIIRNMVFFRNFHRFFAPLVQSSGWRVKQVQVSHSRRHSGKTKYGTWDRAVAGIADLGGVLWLQKRILKPEYKDDYK